MPVKNRLIATLLVHQGVVVQTRKFRATNIIGNVLTAVEFFSTWAVDEIVILEISQDRNGLPQFLGTVKEISARCFVPLSVGGKIRNLDHVESYLEAGADKVVVNTGAFQTSELIEGIQNRYGSQCCIVSMDVRDGQTQSGFEVMINNGREATGKDAIDWVRAAEKLGAGEVLVNHVEYDGNKNGYHLGLIRKIVQETTIPVIAMGGVGDWAHMAQGLSEGGADAVAAGNIFHYKEHSTRSAKEFLLARGFPMRKAQFYKLPKARTQEYRPISSQK